MGSPVDQALISYKNPELTLEQMKSFGIKYIIINNNLYKEAGKDGYTAEVNKVMDEILAEDCRMLYSNNYVCLYEIEN